MFEMKEVVKDTERLYAFVCLEHGGMDPVAEVEVSSRKAAQARVGLRPKIIRDVYLRVSCKLCERSVSRKLDNVVARMEE